MARIVVEHLTKAFPGPAGEVIQAVDDASFAVEDKELLVLVGPSGCGKTTTLRLIAGLEEPDAGTISMDGRVVNRVPPGARDVAMVFQHHALYPHLSAYQNLAFGLKLRKVPRVEIERRVNEVAEMLGLGDCLGRLPQELSGGQRQRVALGRALVRRPKLLLLDEPLSNLDGPMRHQLRTEIARLPARLGVGMIYVTHDQVEAMTLGHRIAVLRHGAIQQVADPLGLYRQPANVFVASFIGSPPMNLFQGVLRQQDRNLWLEWEREKLRLSEGTPGPMAGFVGKGIILGIRPEDIALASGTVDGVPKQAVTAVVEAVEPVGPEIYLRAAGEGYRFVVRVSSSASVRVQERMSFLFDLDRAHVFDAATGRRMG